MRAALRNGRRCRGTDLPTRQARVPVTHPRARALGLFTLFQLRTSTPVLEARLLTRDGLYTSDQGHSRPRIWAPITMAAMVAPGACVHVCV